MSVEIDGHEVFEGAGWRARGHGAARRKTRAQGSRAPGTSCAGTPLHGWATTCAGFSRAAADIAVARAAPGGLGTPVVSFEDAAAAVRATSASVARVPRSVRAVGARVRELLIHGSCAIGWPPGRCVFE